MKSLGIELVRDSVSRYSGTKRVATELPPLIWNSFEDLEETAITKLRQQFQIPIFPIGPFHKHNNSTAPSSITSMIAEDHSSISWLDKHRPKSVIYISFGTNAAMAEVARGLAGSGHPFLWVMRPGGLTRGEPLPEGFLEGLKGRGRIVKWAPQAEVLAHPSVGAFWTHCGWNSTLESVCEGVLMICTPRFADQPVNARYVSHVWRVGLQLDGGLSREKVERAVRRVMEEREGVEMRERARVCVRPANW
ncbi:UDP-glycosyltransferase 76F2-like [Salvia miltiorrhiza]|uniref:UDP-glycosyltransferase 76F2-like n=1 Tax=Salvia miltiorrhiza TaxID=226208 RepID=UPI0025AC3289|nr:UDP-glycosyltransferase 76F2-like [Salvia miltiorrhiza]